jgi:ankyrin repeat protein
MAPPALIAAVLDGEADRVRELIASGVEVDTTDEDDRTALMHAVVENRPDLVRALLAAGADPNRKSGKRGRTALMLACGFPSWLGGIDAGLLQALVDAGAEVNARDSDGQSALQHALGTNEPALLDQLTANGALLSVPPGHPDLLAQSIRASCFASAKWLVHRGVAVRDAHLLASAEPWEPDTELLRLLIEHGADPDAHGASGATPLMLAAGADRPELVALLLSLGADPNATDGYGARALHWASRAGSIELARRLYDATRPPEETAIDRTCLPVTLAVGDYLALDGGLGGTFTLLTLETDPVTAARKLVAAFSAQRPPRGPLIVARIREVGTHRAPNPLLAASARLDLARRDAVVLERITSLGGSERRTWIAPVEPPPEARARFAAVAPSEDLDAGVGLRVRSEVTAILSVADGMAEEWERLATGNPNAAAGASKLWSPA